MSQNSNEYKLKILYVLDFLRKYSDADNPVKTAEIIDYLAENGIKAERKSIYDDVACLIRYGCDIRKKGGPRGGYYMLPELFEVNEVKILADAVLASRFLSTRKSGELIDKLGTLLPVKRRRELRQKVHVMSRSAHPAESIYENIDRIKQAMSDEQSLSFDYYEWRAEKRSGRVRYGKVKKHGGKRYLVYPLALILDDVNYYMAAYENLSDSIRHYRVDKMERIKSEALPNPEGEKQALRFDPAVYTSSVFDMFAGEERKVVLIFKEEVLGSIIERFGDDIIIEAAAEKDWYKSIQSIRISPRFFAWVLAFGDKMRIEGPQEILEEMKKFLREVSCPYKIEQ